MFPRILKKLKEKLLPPRRTALLIWIVDHPNHPIRVETMAGDTVWPGEGVEGCLVTRGRVVIPEALISETRRIIP
ncbi:MAG: hypothetical protein WCS65_09545 [Verrucomicrobiae bacterium]